MARCAAPHFTGALAWPSAPFAPPPSVVVWGRGSRLRLFLVQWCHARSGPLLLSMKTLLGDHKASECFAPSGPRGIDFLNPLLNAVLNP
ncbi:hypothetical protein E2C01_023376 [Portunus trituberculatus]|uniref:Uncharacterized protein n=1 Tax=Portunus trituberculatus TaxID=210409 RepID=A0A5B7E9T8_PORTR|nr:hypothetical protein [Portunus trituberculatus]